ncbi:hypothetical protein HanIR_Chr05g0231241 [Helianthus annuus]|nr:hypothetical protein HanIR_Chr05g0231241 [Helianthus annuus]
MVDIGGMSLKPQRVVPMILTGFQHLILPPFQPIISSSPTTTAAVPTPPATMAAFTNLILKPTTNIFSTTKLHVFTSHYNPKLQAFLPHQSQNSHTTAFCDQSPPRVLATKTDDNGAAKTKNEEDKVQHIHTVAEFEAALRDAKQKLVVVEFAARNRQTKQRDLPLHGVT